MLRVHFARVAEAISTVSLDPTPGWLGAACGDGRGWGEGRGVRGGCVGLISYQCRSMEPNGECQRKISETGGREAEGGKGGREPVPGPSSGRDGEGEAGTGERAGPPLTSCLPPAWVGTSGRHVEDIVKH